MSRRKLILSAFGAVVLIGLLGENDYSQPAIIGRLPSPDVREIRRLATLELKRYKWETPSFAWADVRDLGFFLRRVKRYATLHILWIDATGGQSVEVVIGSDMGHVRSDGWWFTLRKDSEWKVTGASYWGSPGGFPADLHVPRE